MRDLDRHSITQAVVKTFDSAKSPRLRQLMSGLVQHLHQFAREVLLTPEEWWAAIEFLTATGQICTAERQEFVMLSDTLGLSTLLGCLQSGPLSEATPTSVLGPFFQENAPIFQLGDSIAHNVAGEEILVRGRVLSTLGAALPGSWLDVWQASPAGLYDAQEVTAPVTNLRGRLQTDAEGVFHFRTVLPAGYPVPTDGPVGKMLLALGRHPYRPAHLHFLIEAPGHPKLTTSLFVDPDPYLDSDAVFGVSQPLVVRVADATEPQGLRSLSYDFHLAPLE